MKKKILTPFYTKEFKCIGSKCEDSCCVGWNISIDKHTFKNYKNIGNKDFRIKLNKYIKRNRHSQCEGNYGYVKLLDDGRCPFLNNNNLCDIFINIGEDNLSNTCTFYPRVYNQVDDAIEKSLTLSCPVAAKLVLLNKDLMEFDEIESDEKTGNMIKCIDTHDNKNFWLLRIFTIDLLQNRNYSIENRLIILGMFYEEVNKDYDNLEIIIDKFKIRIRDKIYDEFLNNFCQANDLRLDILKQIIEAKVSNNNNIDKVFLDFYYKTKQGLAYDKDDNNLVESYNLCYKNYYNKFISDKEYIMENLLVNYVFQNMFSTQNDNIFDFYIMMSIHYALIKTHLVGLSGCYKENFSEDIVVMFIQKFSKVVLHNYNYVDWIFESIKENHLDSMAHMVMFIKD